MEELKDKWFNIEDIAEYLSITQDTARTWVRDGKLPAYKVESDINSSSAKWMNGYEREK